MTRVASPRPAPAIRRLRKSSERDLRFTAIWVGQRLASRHLSVSANVGRLPQRADKETLIEAVTDECRPQPSRGVWLSFASFHGARRARESSCTATVPDYEHNLDILDPHAFVVRSLVQCSPVRAGRHRPLDVIASGSPPSPIWEHPGRGRGG